MKDDIPCGKIDGAQTYWNPEESRCTIERSPLCELIEDAEPLGELSTAYIFTSADFQKHITKPNTINITITI